MEYGSCKAERKVSSQGPEMILSKRRRRLWHYYIRQLKVHFHPGVPIHVRTANVRCYSGDCDATMKLGRLTAIKIRINSSRPWEVRTESLVHEWAHAMDWPNSWHDDRLVRIHNEVWGVWYSKIYQHLYDRCWVNMGERGLLTQRQLQMFPLDIYEWDG